MSNATSRMVGAAQAPAPKARGEVIPPPFHRVTSLPARGAGAFVWVYQKAVSPVLASVSPWCGCRFAPTCSHYAREALREHGLIAGLALSVRRLVKCGPWHPGGLDPVPSRRAPICSRVTPPASLVLRP